MNEQFPDITISSFTDTPCNVPNYLVPNPAFHPTFN
jgi:hypothetical protein